ncbi:MAG: DUF4430 domain-containing protein [Clostridia bacterium]|nr:DUF4430 domain-containing protein [Clostridia bacterium]
MKNKIFALLLLTAISVALSWQTAFFSQSNNVGEYKKLLDDIVVYNLKYTGTENIAQWLEKGAGSGADFYAISIRQLGDNASLTAYADAIEKYIASNDVKSDVTRQKNGLALMASGKKDSELLLNLADTTVGEMGIMSLIYGLFLLNNGAYSEKFTAEKVADELVSMQFADGGWALSGIYSDVDVTSMTIQALSPHISINQSVAESVDKAVSFLSQKQLDDGGFQSYGTENPESSAQAIIALTSAGIDPINDERFIKNGKNPFDGMMKFRLEDGSFSHFEGQSSNGMATYQAFMAITAIIRFNLGLGPLFMFDETTNDNDISFEEDIILIEEEQNTHEEEIAESVYGPESEKNDDNDTEIDEYSSEDVKSGGNSKKILIAAIISVAGAAFIIVCIIKKQKAATYIFVVAITGILIGAVFLTDIETPDNYYGKNTNKENAVGTVTIQIRCDVITEFDSEYIPKSGVILPETEFDIEDGDTVYDILVEAVKKFSIHIETTGPKNIVYINGINHLYEFDYGDLSGWIYKVNGETVSVGCGQCTLKDGDRIVWSYTRELGLDLD